MEWNVILAGVGGQGILTIARALSTAALQRGLNVRQAEVHGMSQRGGQVQSHLRIADHALHSDLVPVGKADLVIAVEPLEALRYVQYLRADGAVIAGTNPVVNIVSYPPLEPLLERIARFPNHVLLDADRLARSAGSLRSSNIVLLGAASLFLDIELAALERGVAEMFSEKGAKVVETNRRALHFGRRAASAYLNGLRCGGSSRGVRQWLDTLTAEDLAAPEEPGFESLEFESFEERLSSAEAGAVEQMLARAHAEGRRQLFEHEVYALIEVLGAITPPRHIFVPAGSTLADEALASFPGERVVLKIVSPDIVHKSDADGVVFVRKDAGLVRQEIERLVSRHGATAHVAGVLVVEFVPRRGAGLGYELFVGVRATREFGPVIAAGLGGIDTEFLADKMRPGVAVAKAVATDISAEEFLDLFRKTAAYDLLSGQARGHERIVSDGELLRCFRAFISIARRFCVDRGDTGPDLGELEVNPFAFTQQRMIPLDGRGRLAAATHAPRSRPLDKLPLLLEPRSVAVLGVSCTSVNYGRIILRNIRDCGFPSEHLYVIRAGEAQIDGVTCVESLAALPEPLDLLVVAAGAERLPVITQEIIDSGRVQTAIMIAGGVGETEGSAPISEAVHDAILAGRRRPDRGPLFLGPNCMGVQSRPGRYDTFFVPPHKLDPRRGTVVQTSGLLDPHRGGAVVQTSGLHGQSGALHYATSGATSGATLPDKPRGQQSGALHHAPQRVALISQSGAFIVSRLSNLAELRPALTISVGNQIDLTMSDLLDALGQRDDLDVIGVYCEGFADLDGLAFCRAVRAATQSGKLVIVYKAGRTAPGRSAAAGHTASVAGDYDVCQAAAAQAGALVVDTFKEFEQTLELATALHGKRVGGRRIAGVTNAGFEAVGMADAIHGARYDVEMRPFSAPLAARVAGVLRAHRVEALVNPRNPIDLTAMGTEPLYEDCARLLLAADEVDALVVSIVPLSPTVSTTPDELSRPGTLAQRLPALFTAADKPLIAIIDAGPLYDELASAIRAGGVPVFRTCDQAIRSLGRYLFHRSGRANGGWPDAPAEQGHAPSAPNHKPQSRERGLQDVECGSRA